MNKIETLIEKLYSQKNYRLIITAFDLYSYNTKPTGLTQKHFRYLFGDRKNLHPNTIEKLEKFFMQFDWLGEQNYEETMTQKDINHYLNYLCRKKIIKPLNKIKPLRYTLTMLYYKNYSIIKIKENLSKWDYNNERNYYDKTESILINWTLFSTMIQDKRIDECMKVIHNEFKKIIEIKKEQNQKEATFDFYLHAEA